MKTYAKTMFVVLIFIVTMGSLNIYGSSQPSDETIAFWVREALREDPRIDASDMKVKIQSGIATLSGTANNLSSKKYAILETKKIAGVRAVVDKLVVRVTSRSDTDITQDILRRFLHNSDIEHQGILVKVLAGAVTLSGQVDSWAERQEAELVASEVRGVTSVKNELKVSYETKRPDEEIRTDVLATLRRDVYLAGLPIKVFVEKGVVTLKGSVASPYEKDRASDDSFLVVGVRDVKSLLEVEGVKPKGVRSKAPSPSNEELRKSVRDELYQDLRVADPNEIHVEAVEGHVTLRGVVPTHYEERLATHDAKDVVGVVWVSNLLTVSAEWREDSAVRDDVQFELAADATLSGLNIIIRVKDGVVTLYGDVNSQHEKEHAAEVASLVQGVREVINKITVNAVPRYNDASLKARIETRLTSNWETRWVADQIKVYVENGMVTLAGDVDTWAEYKEAARVASLTEGTRSVINRLRVIDVNYPWTQSGEVKLDEKQPVVSVEARSRSFYL